MRGFEPPASRSRTVHSARLSYTPFPQFVKLPIIWGDCKSFGGCCVGVGVGVWLEEYGYSDWSVVMRGMGDLRSYPNRQIS